MANTVNELRKTSKGRLSYQRKRTLEDIYKEIDNFICLSVTPVKNYEFEKQEKVNIGSVTKSAPKKFKVEKTVESSKNFVDSDAISKYAQIEQSLIDYELERKNYVKKQIAERLASWEKCSLEYRKKFETCSSEVSKEPEKHENANTTQNTSESQEVNNNSLNTQWITKEETQLSKEKAKQPEEELLIEKERKLEILEKLNMIYLKLKFIASEILEKYNRLNCKNQPNKGINLIYRLKDIVTLMDSYSISDDPDMYLETAKSHLEECRRMLKFFTDLGNSNENDMNNNSSAIECSEVDNIVSGSSETDITITQNAAMDVVPQISMDVMNCNAVASQSPPLEFVSFPQSNKLSSLTSSDQTTKNCRNFEIKIHKFKKIQKPEISISESAVAISKVPESTSTNVFQGVTVSEISSKSQILAPENMQLDENKKADSNEFSKDETHCQYVDKDALIEYTALLQFAETWKNLYQTFVTDSKWKKAKFDLQKAVNTPINSTSDVSAEHLHDKMKRLETFLSGHNIEVAGKTICINVCSEGKYFCLDLLAKKIVGQGESQISSRPEAAFPLAALTVFLCQKYPDLLKLFLAHLYKKCPYLVPYYIPRKEGQSEDDYYRQLGYVYSEGVIEKQVMFLKRMSGIVRLYAAVIQTPPILNSPHPHGMKHAWIWLARLLNLEPRSDITATILVDFLEVAGYVMQKTYGKQFQKLIEALAIEFLPKIKQATLPGSGGPLQRLESFLEEYFKKGTVPQPSGILDSTFWKIS